MIKGITYYKLVSDYEGAIPPKDCGLKGEEIDNNFYVLEGRDVKGVTVEDNKIVITLVNGDTISSEDVFSNFAKDLSFDFDSETGTLYITQNGQTTEITGFGCGEDCCYTGVYTDSTLTGKGTADSPLSISPMYRPGTYAPVSGFIDLAHGETLPDTANLPIGTRYVVADYINDYGMLYCYDGVKQIACELQRSHSEWRIPTKEDWDDMLNAIELSDNYRDHNGVACNRFFGKFAGKFLKTSDLWREYEENPGMDPNCVNPCENCCYQHTDPCAPAYCGEYGQCCRPSQSQSTDPTGVDKYGFGVKPAGYGDDSYTAYFGERAEFWTATNTCGGSTAYVKRFDWNKSTVYQDVVPDSHYNSLRLVKDYNGSNYYGRETILTHDYDTVIMPSMSSGSKVWTAINFNETGDNLCAKEPNNGEGLTKTLVYYIVEWDGTRWITVRLNEGDGVTIVENGTVVEYHIVINPESGIAELVPSSQGTADEVMQVIQPKLDALDAKIDAEIERATNAENALGERIDAVEAKNTEQDGKLSELESGLAQEIQNRIDGDQNLQNQIDEIIAGQGSAEAVSKQLIKNGSFSKETSEITLSSLDNESTVVKILMSFDFGEVPEL